MVIRTKYFKSPFGEFILGEFNHQLCLCDWRYRKMRESIDERIKLHLKAEFKEEDSEISSQTILQLEEYFKGTRKQFSIPLLFAGSAFQQSVWNELLQIPFGKTETYTGLSLKIGNLKAIRAVASANGANAISILVPCHRVIGSNGELTGYAGGIEAKRKLLLMEGSIPMINSSQITLF